MIIQLLEGFGLNTDLFVDLIAVGSMCFILLTFLAQQMCFRGMTIPLLRSKLRKENAAILDLGGIETPMVNYPRSSTELLYERKKHRYSWNIPNGIERMLPNGTKYVLASTKSGGTFNQRAATEGEQATQVLEAMDAKYQNGGEVSEGDAYNISEAAAILQRIRPTLSPKGQANTIDDRAKQIADKQMANVNKTMLYAAGVGIVLVICIFGYLVFTKAMEYKMCETLSYVVTTTTMPKLPPL